MKIDKKHLPVDLDTSPGLGFYAESYPSGALKSFAYYRDGKVAGEILELEDSKLQGKTTRVDTFEADSENSDQIESERKFQDWVELKIREIVERGQFVLRCAFCEKTQAEVLKLIAGPTCYICNECIAVCSEIISEESATL